VRKQRIALEHHVDRPPIGRNASDILPVEQDASLVRGLEAREQAQQRGLAAPGRSEQGKELAGENIEGHVLNRGDTGEALAHAVEPEQRPRRGVRPRRERPSRIASPLIVAHAGIPHVTTLTARAVRLNTRHARTLADCSDAVLDLDPTH
jgi:hypothetical protein